MKEDCRTSKILQAGNRLIKYLATNVIPFKKNEGWLRGWNIWPRGQSLKSQKTTLRPWNLVRFSILDFKISWDQWVLSSFHWLSFEITVILCLSHHCILGAYNLFPSSTGPWWRGILFQNGSISSSRALSPASSSVKL